MVLIDPAGPGGQPHALPLYGTAKVEPARAAALGVPREAVEPPRLPDEKALVWLQRLPGAGASAPFPVAAVVVPRVGSHETGLRSASRGAALAALAPSTLLLPGGGAAREAMAAMTRLVAALPAFTLDLGPDPASAPPVLERLASQLAAEVTA
jgi:hypothetical protein